MIDPSTLDGTPQEVAAEHTAQLARYLQPLITAVNQLEIHVRNARMQDALDEELEMSPYQNYEGSEEEALVEQAKHGVYALAMSVGRLKRKQQ